MAPMRNAGTLIALALAGLLLAEAAWAARRASRRPPAVPPPAAQFEPPDAVLSVRPSADGRTVHLAGWLDAGSFLKVRRVLDANPRATALTLASPGGLVLEGVLIGNAVRDRRLATRVATLCASTCTMILAAGSERVAGERAWIGFHGAANPLPAGTGSEGTGELARQIDPDVLLRNALLSAGVDRDFVSGAMAVPPDQVWYPPHAQLLAVGVLTRLDGALDSDPPAETWRARTAALLASDPLWPMAERRMGAAYGRALDHGWRLASSGADEAQVRAEALSELMQETLLRIATAGPFESGGFLGTLAAFPPELCIEWAAGNRQSLADQQRRLAGWMAEILASEAAQPVPALGEARATLRPMITRVRRAFPGLNASSPPTQRCRAGLALMQRIANSDEKKRLAAFRAYAVLHAVRELPGFTLPL